MPDPTNFIGQFIRYQIDPGQAGAADGALTPLTNRTAVAATNIGPNAANPVGTPWNFTFLKYSAGEVTTCDLNGATMTGPFSGCFAFTYLSGMQAKLAHVGTSHSPQDPGTIRAKAIWQGVIDGGATNIKGESPFSVFSIAEQQKISTDNGNSLPVVCGYYENANAWAIVFVGARNGMVPVPGVLKIAAARRMPMLDWTLVKAMRQFK